MLFKKKTEPAKLISKPEEVKELFVPEFTQSYDKVDKVRKMLRQVDMWIREGEDDLAKIHWKLIAEECLKNAEQ